VRFDERETFASKNNNKSSISNERKNFIMKLTRNESKDQNSINNSEIVNFSLTILV
jgi:hypothetical protein